MNNVRHEKTESQKYMQMFIMVHIYQTLMKTG